MNKYKNVTPYKNWNEKTYSFRTPSYGYGSIQEILPEKSKRDFDRMCIDYASNKLRNKTNVYITQLSDIPTYKVKNYVDENKLNINVTRKVDTIDTFVINKEMVLNYYFDKYKYKTFIKVPFQQFIDIGIPVNLEPDKEASEFIVIDIELLNADFQKACSAVYQKLLTFEQVTGYYVSNGWGGGTPYKQLGLFMKMLELVNNKKADIVFDSEMASDINKEMHIDIEVFQNLYNMLKSSDPQNHNMARELIANCDFERSKHFILFLVSVFNTLRTKSQNKNYHSTYSQIKKYGKYYRTYDTDSHQYLLSSYTKDYPEHKQDLCDCLKIHTNSQLSFDLIGNIKAL